MFIKSKYILLLGSKTSIRVEDNKLGLFYFYFYFYLFSYFGLRIKVIV